MKFKWIQSLKPMLFSLLLFSTLGDLCPGPGPGGNGETPADSTGCGVGIGDYNVYLVNTVPESFNCNDSGSFVITLRPDIHTSYTGPSDLVFNRLYFILKSGYDSVITNYVEFLTEDTLDKRLEWGGSLPTGDYEVRGIMKNIQLNSSCKDSVHRAACRDLGWIYITEFAYPQKVMQIEYDCQESYDVFMCSRLEEYMDIAFNIANTTYNIIEDNKNLPTETVVFENPWTEFRQYIIDHKQNDSYMYLCGIKRFISKDSIPLSTFGATQNTWDFHPDSLTGSLIAVKFCIDWSAGRYDVNYEDIMTATVIHELGLQRAIRYEGIECTSPFCIMFGSPIYPDRCIHLNPHFCEQCLGLLRNIQW
jgi:hypothetical protein